MTWGLHFPTQFGQFFPEGNFVGWLEALDAHFENTLTDEERRPFDDPYKTYRSYVSGKFRHGSPVLDPVLDYEWPSEYQIRRMPKRLASLFRLPDGVLVVDQTIKTIIERLEPGVHQFNQIKISRARAVNIPGPFYAMVIRQHLDSFDPEASVDGSVRGEGNSRKYSAFLFNKRYVGGLALTPKVIADKHLWCERRLWAPEILISDELQDEIQRANLIIPKHYQLKDMKTENEAKAVTTLSPWGSKAWVDFQYQNISARPKLEVPKNSVWGMFEPYREPGFAPEGNFPDWADALRDHHRSSRSFLQKILPIPAKYPHQEILAKKFSEDLGELALHERPTLFHAGQEIERYPSLIRLRGEFGNKDFRFSELFHVLAVDAALKSIIEKLEPDLHQFWPLSVVFLGNQTTNKHSFYGLLIRQHLDSLLVEESRPSSYRETDGLVRATSISKNAAAGLAVSSKEIGSAHLWREKNLKRPSILMSGTLVSAIEQQALIIPKHFKMKLA